MSEFYIVGQGHSNPCWNVTVVQVCKKYNEGIISELYSYQIYSSVFSINRENLWKQALNSFAVLWREYGVINLGLSSFLVSIEVNVKIELDAKQMGTKCIEQSVSFGGSNLKPMDSWSEIPLSK